MYNFVLVEAKPQRDAVTCLGSLKSQQKALLLYIFSLS